jgi:hypothetical protein
MMSLFPLTISQINLRYLKTGTLRLKWQFKYLKLFPQKRENKKRGKDLLIQSLYGIRKGRNCTRELTTVILANLLICFGNLHTKIFISIFFLTMFTFCLTYKEWLLVAFLNCRMPKSAE